VDDARRSLDVPDAVRAGEELPLDRLTAWLKTALPDFDGPVSVEQFPSGYSNLTYLLTIGSRELVLRRPPPGHQVKTGHDMGREVRVLSRLSAVYAAAPKPLAFCEDESVLGAPFYLMERRRGVILRQKLPPGVDLSPENVRRLSESVVSNLASLHAIDYRAAGLTELGHPEGYVERQVSGWTKRYHDAKTDDVLSLEEVAVWLAANRPKESGAALLHNDYKYDNLVLDEKDVTRIVAVLDWEMSTIGDPLMDLGTTLGYWVEKGDPVAWQALRVGPTSHPGSPTRRELADRYGVLTGRDVSHMLFYYVFALFKVAGIAQQIYFRYRKGFTKDPRFGTLDKMVSLLGTTAAAAIESGRF
jgi:aminoglycoside phosphotransferase (APT) family kinase protein